MSINLSTILVRDDDDLLTSALADETVMMNVETGDYLGLNEVGTKIWELLENPVSGSTICEQLLRDFDIDKKTCEEQTINFLNHLVENNLVNIQNS